MKLSAYSNIKLLVFGILIVIIPVVIYLISNTALDTSETYTSGAEEAVENTDKNNPDFEGIENTDDAAITTEKSEKDALLNNKTARNPEDTNNNFNILILGIDRRYGEQSSWRTDVIQLLTLSPKRDKAVLTHIPRDVWATTYKINAVYNLKGPDSIKDEVQKITGQRPDRIIRVDFDAFVWLVDSMGGLSIDVPTAFVDSSYPNDRKGVNEPITVEFEKGSQVMDGEKALIYARSRKGTNGEGSDYARGRRQQLIMKEIIDDFFKPDNLFKPKTADTLYNIATQKVYTDVTLSDTKVLFEVLKNYQNISLKNLGLDTTNYLVVPDSSNYGGQWVLAAKDNNYTPIHSEINKLLNE